jgi:hypothetical protein
VRLSAARREERGGVERDLTRSGIHCDHRALEATAVRVDGVEELGYGRRTDVSSHIPSIAAVISKCNSSFYAQT